MREVINGVALEHQKGFLTFSVTDYYEDAEMENRSEMTVKVLMRWGQKTIMY